MIAQTSSAVVRPESWTGRLNKYDVSKRRICSCRQRRQFSAEFKARVVLEVLSGQKRAAEVCREHQLKPDLLSRWKADFVTPAASVFQGDERTQRAEQRIGELERLVGRLTLELEVAKKAVLLSVGSSGAR